MFNDHHAAGEVTRSDKETVVEQAVRLRAVLDAAVDGIVTIDDRGIIESVNSATTKLFGYDAEEMVGQNVSILMPLPFRGEHNQYLENYRQSGTPKIIGIGREVEGRRKDGSTFPMDLSVGEVNLADRRLFTGIIRDLTAQKTIQEELKKRDQQVQFMIENLPAGAVYVDRKKEEIFCNPTIARITGYERESLVSFEDWFEKLYGPNAEEIRSIYERDRQQNFELVRTIPYLHSDGTSRVMEISGYRYNAHEVWLVRDVTEHQEAERRAVQAERLAAIGQMVTGLAHESRNALQRAQAGLDVLSLDMAAPQQTLVGQIRRALNDLTTLYEEVRQYASPIHLRREPTPIRTVWVRAWQSLATKLDEKPVRFVDSSPELDPICDVDSFRMEQVFRNIFENAVDASPAGTTITVGISSGPAHNESIEITIADEGPGLDANQKARVFEPFYTTKQKGTGLGMAIVSRIIELHDGRIACESSAALGALFRIRLAVSTRVAVSASNQDEQECV